MAGKRTYRVSWRDHRIIEGDLEFDFDVLMTEAEAAKLRDDMYANKYIFADEVAIMSAPVDFDFLRRNNPEIWRLDRDPGDPAPDMRSKR